MAKSEVSVKLFPINKAQRYLNDNGHTVSSQQVRHLLRTNPIITNGWEWYTDPVTDATTKVIRQAALDEYLAWRVANPEGQGRGGNRKSDGSKRASAVYTPDQLAQINEWLLNAGFPVLEIPVRKPRKAKEVSETQHTNGVADVSSDVDLSKLDLLEIA